MAKQKKIKKNLNISGKHCDFPFEEDIKALISDKISENPDEFVEKMISEFKDHWVFGKRNQAPHVGQAHQAAFRIPGNRAGLP